MSVPGVKQLNGVIQSIGSQRIRIWSKVGCSWQPSSTTASLILFLEKRSLRPEGHKFGKAIKIIVDHRGTFIFREARETFSEICLYMDYETFHHVAHWLQSPNFWTETK